MVDRVELYLVDHIEQVGNFDDCLAVLLEQGTNSAEHPVEVLHMGQHIVGMDDIGAPTFRGQAPRKLAPEKLFDRLDATLLPRDPRDIACRLDSQHGNCVGSIIPEKVAVVARNLDDKTTAMPVAASDHSLGDLARMRQEGVREGGA